MATVLVSIAFAEWVEFPYVKYLRKICNRWGGVPAKPAVETIHVRICFGVSVLIKVRFKIVSIHLI